MFKRVSFCIITGFVISLPMLGIWVQSERNQINANPNSNSTLESSLAVSATASSPPSSANINNEKTLAVLLQNTSLEETDPPEAFEVTNGIVQKTENLRSIFEYFLSLDGELPLDAIKSALMAYALEMLPLDQAQQVSLAFDQYFSFLSEMSDAQSLLDPQSELAEKHQWIKNKRREILGEALADAYFGYDESYDSYQLSKLNIINDDSLSGQEKFQALAALSEQLPHDIRTRELKDNSTKHALVMDRQIRYELSEDEIFEARLNVHGYEATQRLTDLDKQRADWESRYNQYQQMRQNINSSTLSSYDQQQAINELRQRHFSEKEIIRVTTLDEYQLTNY